MEAVLITGGTGLIGSRLSKELRRRKKEVRILSRTPGSEEFYWNPEKNEIDSKALENVHTVIHLAGAPISKRWTKKYKKELYDSRIGTAEFLFKKIKESAERPKSFITASGTNYYGTVSGSPAFTENDPPGNDYLAHLCTAWEKAALRFETLNMRVGIVRTPAVLSTGGGMLEKLLPLAKRGLLSPLGSGKQIIPWVHIGDLCHIYIHLMENEKLNGPFNAVAPEITDNKSFTKTLMKAVGRRVSLPAVPAFMLRLIMGEMSGLLLEGSPVSGQKITDSGFNYQYSTLIKALSYLLPKNSF